MQGVLMGAWWGPRPCDTDVALDDLRRWTQVLAEAPGGVPAWSLLRASWDEPERVALVRGAWQLPPGAVARFNRDETTGAALPGFGVSVSLIEAGWTAAAGRSKDDLHAATLRATLGSTLPAVPNQVLLELWGQTLPGPALWQPCLDALVLGFLPDHAAVVDGTQPGPRHAADPSDAPDAPDTPDIWPPWARGSGCIARYPPDPQAMGCTTDRDAAAKARLQAAGRLFDAALARAAASGDRTCADHRADIAPLLLAVARGEVAPPAEPLYRARWHSEDPAHGLGTPVHAAEASFLSALSDWPAKPWYAAALGAVPAPPAAAVDAAGGSGDPPAPGRAGPWTGRGWRSWFTRR